MTRRAAPLGALLGMLALVAPALADDATVNAVQINRFANVGVGQATQGLVFEGGLELRSAADTFGGLSGIGFTNADGHLVMVSDSGNIDSGQLLYGD